MSHLIFRTILWVIGVTIPILRGEKMEAWRDSDVPWVVKLGWMLVICPKACQTPKPGVAFISRQCRVWPALGEDPGIYCVRWQCDYGFSRKESGENSCGQPQTLAPRGASYSFTASWTGLVNGSPFIFPVSQKEVIFPPWKAKDKICILGLFLVHINVITLCFHFLIR